MKGACYAAKATKGILQLELEAALFTKTKVSIVINPSYDCL